MVKFGLFLSVFCVLSVFRPACTLNAQQSGASIYGQVLSGEDGYPIEFAVVSLLPSKIYTTTDAEGRYRIDNVPVGDNTVQASFFGMSTDSRELRVVSGKEYKVDFSLSEITFRMQEVVVTATKGEAGNATSSVISRQAMDHLQASSLGDVMSLLP